MTHALRIFPIIVPIKTPLKSINFYLVLMDNELFLIDAGLHIEDCWQALLHTLQENDFSLTDLTAIAITHHHGDHVGLINRITKEHPIPVYAHPDAVPRLRRDAEHIERRIEFFAKLYAEMGCGEAGINQVNYLKQAAEKNAKHAITCELRPVASFPLPMFDLIEAPGHAIDQIIFYHKTEKIAFVGDLLIEHISSNALVEPDDNGQRMRTLVDHEQSLQKVLPLDIERAFSGHGNVIKNTKELIAKRITGIENKAQRFLTALAGNKLSASELAQRFYKETYKKQFSLVMSEVIGHLDYLEEKGHIGKRLKENVWHYFATTNTEKN